jgi:hypothetical protein
MSSAPVLSSLQHALSLLSLLCLHHVLCSRAQFTTACTQSSQSAVSSPCPLLLCSVHYSTHWAFSVRCVFTVSSAPVLSSLQHALSLLSPLCLHRVLTGVLLNFVTKKFWKRDGGSSVECGNSYDEPLPPRMVKRWDSVDECERNSPDVRTYWPGIWLGRGDRWGKLWKISRDTRDTNWISPEF